MAIAIEVEVDRDLAKLRGDRGRFHTSGVAGYDGVVHRAARGIAGSRAMTARAALFGCVVALCGCGRVAFDPLGDGRGDGDTGGGMSLQLPAGGQFSAIAVAPDGTWYALSKTAGVFRSDDHATWTHCAAIYGTGITVAADNNVWVSGAATMRSTDRCASWSNSASPWYSNNVAFVNGQLWALADRALLRFDGTAWQGVTTPNDGLPFYSIAATSNALMVATSNGILYSPTGVTWSRVTAGLPTANVQEVAAGPTRAYAITISGSGGIACGSSDGATWTSCATPGGYGLFVDPGNEQRVLGAVYDDLVITTNGFGAVTRGVREPMGLDYATVLDIQADPDGTIVAATDRGVWASPPSATVAFAPVFDGLAAWDIDVIVRDGDDTYLATRGGVLHAAGTNPFTISTAGIKGNTHIRDLAVAPDGPLIALGRNIVASSDRGQTWTMLAPLDLPDNYYATSIVFVGTQAYVGTAGRLITAAPPYTSWSPIVVAGAARLVTSLLAVAGTLYIGTQDGLFATTDGGMTFTRLSMRNTRTLCLLADGGLAVGTSYGAQMMDATRTTLVDAGLTARGIGDFVESAGTLIAATDDGIAYTKDRGATWLPVPGAETTPASSLLIDDGKLVIGKNDGLMRVALP
jgi:hypothetical protein